MSEPINVEVSTIIDADPDALYDLVADVTRMGEWSPETRSASWLGDADHARVGARFKGDNELGPNSWSTKPTVTVAERGHEFAFDVPGKSGPTWRYRFEPVDGGHWVSGASLAPTMTATTVAKNDGDNTVTDGPYVETKEALGGYYLISAADLDEAIELATAIPIPVGHIEVRPVAFRPDAG